MPQRPSSLVSVEEAIRAAPTLAQLGERIRESSARMEVIRPLLPPALRDSVLAGPFDARGWRLLAPSNAAAAKLRQLKPALQDALAAARLPAADITIRIRKGRAPSGT